jgi:hypothetical protein
MAALPISVSLILPSQDGDGLALCGPVRGAQNSAEHGISRVGDVIGGVPPRREIMDLDRVTLEFGDSAFRFDCAVGVQLDDVGERLLDVAVLVQNGQQSETYRDGVVVGLHLHVREISGNGRKQIIDNA